MPTHPAALVTWTPDLAVPVVFVPVEDDDAVTADVWVRVWSREEIDVAVDGVPWRMRDLAQQLTPESLTNLDVAIATHLSWLEPSAREIAEERGERAYQAWKDERHA